MLQQASPRQGSLHPDYYIHSHSPRLENAAIKGQQKLTAVAPVAAISTQREPTKKHSSIFTMLFFPFTFLWYIMSKIHFGILKKRVPVLLQMSEVECGSACLAMILRYYGRKASISEISERCNVGRNGLSALSLVRAGRDYGLQVRAISLQENDFRQISLPAIVYWQFNHFLIIERWSTNGVNVVDPARGRVRLSASEFEEGFTGVVILLTPGTQFVRHTNPQQLTLTSYAAQYIKHAPFLLIQIIGASLLLQTFGLMMPLLTKIVVDQIIPTASGNVLPLLAIGMVGIVLTQCVTMLLRSFLLVYLQARIDMHIMPNFFEHLLSLSPSFFMKRSHGDMLARYNSQSTVRDIISSQLISVVLDGSAVIVYLFILLTQSLSFALLALGLGFLQLFILLSSSRLLRSLARQELESMSKEQGYVGEILTGMNTLKAAGAESRAFTRWSNLFYAHLNITLRRNTFASFVSSIRSTVQSLTPVVMLWIGTTQVLSGHMQTGTMLALNTLAVIFLAPLVSLANNGQQLQIVKAHLERITDIADAHPEQDVQRVQLPPRLTGDIRLEHVNFKYDANSPLALNDITLSIKPGMKIAIVGRTGSGKSTLGKLLLGLNIPTKGEIFYDNIPLRYLNYQAVRSQCGVVMQESGIFSGTIRQNIALNAVDLSMEQIVRAAQLAELHDDILQMPLGYDTFVSEGGSALSGGQRQRLALARALAHSPAILLLDEATSSLDVVTEQKVEHHLNHLSCTQVIIAHRLSTIRNANQILVLDNGRLVEQGSHAELVRHSGYYAQLIQSQLATGEVQAR